MYGNIGVDVLLGGTGNDTLFGGQNEGATTTYGSGTTLAYREGTDKLSSGAGSDLIYGNHGGDLLLGGDSWDTIYGGQDEDAISGGAGLDVLYGNLGNDQISGGASWDYLYGQGGNDTLTGGGSGDYFYIQSGGGNDTITDFTVLTDYLAIESNINSSGITSYSDVVANATQTGSDVVIDLGAGQTVTLQNYSVSSLSSFDVFLF